MTQTLQRYDANIGFFQDQLTHFEQKIFENYFPDSYKFASGTLVPIMTYNTPGVEYSAYRVVEYFGEFQLAGNNTTEFPEVKSAWYEVRLPVSRFVSGYSYSVSDLEAMEYANSAAGNFPALDILANNIKGVRQTYIQTLNNLIAYGNPDTGSPGFIGHPSILRSYSPIAIDDNTSSEDILNALSRCISQIPEYTNEKETGKFAVLLPRKYYDILKNRLYTSSNNNSVINKTLLQHFVEANSHYIDGVEVCSELNPQRLAKRGYEVEHQHCIQVFMRDPDAVRSCIYQPLTFNEVREKGAEGFYRSAKMKLGEIQFIRPHSAHITYFQPS